MPRKIKRATIKFISLCRKGANNLKTLYKSAEEGDGEFNVSFLAKEGISEEGKVLGVVYAPNLVDLQGDYASTEVIAQMMETFAKDGEGIDIRHDEQTLSKDQAFVVESFTIQKDDPRFSGLKDYDGNPVDPAGGWGVVIKIDDEDLRQKYRDGEWEGLSMGGVAEFDSAKDSEIASIVKEVLAQLDKSKTSTDGDHDMTPEEMMKALEANNDKLSKSIVAGLAEALKPETTEEQTNKEADENKAPTLPANATPAQLRTFRKEMQAYEIRKSIDPSDPESIEKAAQALEALEGTKEDAGAGTETGTVKKSNQPAAFDSQPSIGESEALSKSASEAVEKYTNKRR